MCIDNQPTAACGSQEGPEQSYDPGDEEAKQKCYSKSIYLMWTPQPVSSDLLVRAPSRTHCFPALACRRPPQMHSLTLRGWTGLVTPRPFFISQSAPGFRERSQSSSWAHKPSKPTVSSAYPVYSTCDKVEDRQELDRKGGWLCHTGPT